MVAYYNGGMQLEAYLYFDGRCEEALEFYKRALGGEYEANRFAGSPMEAHVGPEWAQKILHATFKGDGFTFMGSDRAPGEGGDIKPNVALSLATDQARAETVFQALADGGKIVMPLGPSFWSGSFGMVTDRFGIEWMVSGHSA